MTPNEPAGPGPSYPQNPVSADRLATAALLGRILLSAIFIISGVSKLFNWATTSQFMAMHGVPMPSLFLLGAILIEIVGGLSLLLGFRARQGAALLFLYLIPVTLIFHDFWALGGADRQMQMINFLKNISIMGGLLEVVALGAGRMSLDASTLYRGHHRILDSRDSSVKLRRIS